MKNHENPFRTKEILKLNNILSLILSINGVTKTTKPVCELFFYYDFKNQLIV